MELSKLPRSPCPPRRVHASTARLAIYPDLYIYRSLVLQYYCIAFITRTIAPSTLKRARKAPTASRKRVKTSSSTAAAPTAAETAVASQLPISSSNFESLFRDSQPESAIIAPTVDGSRAATEASADDNNNNNNGGDTRIDAYLVDTYPSLD